MSKDELLDLVNEDDEVIGKVWKSEAHKDPSKIHREVAIGVFNDQKEVLIQQRSMNKKNGPGKWEITAAGHISSGEEPKDAIKREIFEELGLNVDPIFHLKEYAERKGKPGSTEARFFYIYYATVHGYPKLSLDKNEAENAKWVKPEDLNDFAKNNHWDTGGLSHKTIMNIYKEVIING